MALPVPAKAALGLTLAESLSLILINRMRFASMISRPPRERDDSRMFGICAV